MPSDVEILNLTPENITPEQQAELIAQVEELAEAAEQAAKAAEQERIEKLTTIAGLVETKLNKRMGDRSEKQSQWMEALRLYLGSLSSWDGYSSDDLFEKNEVSKRRPEVNIIRNKCEMAIDQTIAYAFAAGDKDWSIGAPANLEIDNEDLEQSVAVAEERGQMISTPEEAVLYRADLMEKEMETHLDQCDYAIEARKGIRDRVILGTAIMKHPVNVPKVVKRYSKKQTSDGRMLRAPEFIEVNLPSVYRVDPWYFFPDDSVTSLKEAEDSIEVHPLSKTQLIALSKNSGFLTDQIALCLEEEPRKYGNSPFTDAAHLTQGINILKNKYLVAEHHGPLSRSDLETVGIEPSYDTGMDDYYTEVWVCNGRVIRIELSNIEGQCSIPYSASVWEPDPASCFGFGIPLLARDQQKVVNETWKMLLDNAGISAGPQVVVDTSIIKPATGGLECEPWKVWYLTEYGADASKAIQFFTPENSFEGLSALFSMSKQLADEESSVNLLASGIQLPTGGQQMGATQMSIANQNAATPLFARAEEWSDQITRPIIQAVYDWEMQYNPKDEIKGSYMLDVRTSTSYLRSSQDQQKLDRIAQEMANGSPIAEWINMDEFAIARIAGMKLPYRNIVKSPQQVAQERQNAPEPPPDPNMIKAQADMKTAENAEQRLQLDFKKLEVETNQKHQEAQMMYQAAMRTDEVRLKEAESQVIAAQFDYQGKMAALASKDDQNRQRIIADIQRSENQEQTKKFLAGLTGQLKAKELAQYDQELQLKRQGKTGI